jgi:hypothetical protein
MLRVADVEDRRARRRVHVGDVAVVALDVDLASADDVDVGDLFETFGLGHVDQLLVQVLLFGTAFQA